MTEYEGHEIEEDASFDEILEVTAEAGVFTPPSLVSSKLGLLIVTVNGAITFEPIVGPSDKRRQLEIEFRQGEGGPFKISWGNDWFFPYGTPPQMSPFANAKDTAVAVWNGSVASLYPTGYDLMQAPEE